MWALYLSGCRGETALWCAAGAPQMKGAPMQATDYLKTAGSDVAELRERAESMRLNLDEGAAARRDRPHQGPVLGSSGRVV